METGEGVIAINPREESYFNLTQTTQVTLPVGAKFHTFVLKNAAASLREGRLAVVAEEIHRDSTAQASGASTNGDCSS